MYPEKYITPALVLLFFKQEIKTCEEWHKHEQTDMTELDLSL